jgi:hypothetical protein
MDFLFILLREKMISYDNLRTMSFKDIQLLKEGLERVKDK